MCGIADILAYGNTAPVDIGQLWRIRIRSRGPDGEGLCMADDQLVHRSLAIIDLFDTSAQPMHDPDTRNRIVFNGERSGVEPTAWAVPLMLRCGNTRPDPGASDPGASWCSTP